ncbi:hypothetical protein Hanom_Chr17g01541151 [Helianthus anomalus]
MRAPRADPEATLERVLRGLEGVLEKRKPILETKVLGETLRDGEDEVVGVKVEKEVVAVAIVVECGG